MWSQATFASPGKGRGQKELRYLQSPGVNFAACARIHSEECPGPALRPVDAAVRARRGGAHDGESAAVQWPHRRTGPGLRPYEIMQLSIGLSRGFLVLLHAGLHVMNGLSAKPPLTDVLRCRE